MVLALASVNITFIDLHRLNHLWIPGKNPTWPKNLFLMICYILLAKMLSRSFVSTHQGDCPFWLSSFLVLVIGVMLTYSKDFRNSASLSMSLKTLKSLSLDL